jgi:hypothetical protein
MGNIWHDLPWWDDRVYEYNNEALMEEVLNKKRKRAEGLVLDIESYSFVTIITQY